MACQITHSLPAALPTPPLSPSEESMALIDPQAHIRRLEQLMSFYHSAGVWVNHTRQALFEIAYNQPSDDQSAPTKTVCPPSPAPSTASTPSTSAGDRESSVSSPADGAADYNFPAEAPSSPQAPALWMRRKHGAKMQLQLDGIGARRRQARITVLALRRRDENAHTAHAHAHGHVAPQVSEAPLVTVPAQLPGEHAARILQLFGDLVGERMESCQRIERMVRSANKADLW